ncbi:hypothetical protein BC830DRAFT_1175071 [Chytriomyces sp. MP71]|nr:hypothetical protein BC830DRAFT_1175071 [Chytriomyces sp. MP71]
MQALIATLKSKLKSRQEWRRGDQAHLVAPAGSPVFAAAPLHAPLQANVAPSTVSPVVATSEPAGSLIETSTEDTLTVAELPESSTDSDVIAIFDGVKDPEKLQRQQDLWPETVTLSTSALSRADAGSLNVKGDKKDQAERAEKQEFVAMVTTTVEFATLEHGSGLTPASVADLDFIANQEVVSPVMLGYSC